jgi:UDP-glucose 4-epimerase
MPDAILVTGAAGFIGSHLVDALLADGQRVIGVDCFSDYYDRRRKEQNIAPASVHASFRLVEADLVTTDLGSLLQDVAQIYHLAGQPGVRGSWGPQFEVYARNNLLATQRLLEASLAMGGVPMVYASSSSIYGNLSSMPLREDMAPAPFSPYGVTKLAAEHLCRLYAEAYGLPTLALRLFSVYGPRQRPDMAFARFLAAALNGQEITVYGDGAQSRDFTHVADVVRAFLAAGDLCRAGGARGQVVNIAGGAHASVNQALECIAGLVGGALRIQRLPAQPGDVRDTWADTQAAAALLGYRPAVGLAAGLERQWQAARAAWQGF